MSSRLSDWTLQETAAGQWSEPPVGEGTWLPAPVPGTVCEALAAAGRFDLNAPRALQGSDFWYRCDWPASPAGKLHMDGLAGSVEIWLGSTLLGRHAHMGVPLELDLAAQAAGQLYLCVRGQASAPKRAGRARWRPRMIQPASLRDVRQTLLGHMPGWCPEWVPLGPYQAVRFVPADAPSPAWSMQSVQAEAREGQAHLSLRLQGPTPLPALPYLLCAGQRLALQPVGAGVYCFEGIVPGAALWTPHTHGVPACHALSVQVPEAPALSQDLGELGFRHVTVDTTEGGFALRVNGLSVFCRGVCWTPTDLLRLRSDPAALQHQIDWLVQGGANMVRVGGTMWYEDEAFYRACNRAGLLVWQDFMLANFDYPARDAAFMAELQAEATYFLTRTRQHPCLAVLCGGSEVRQQAEMLGVDWPEDDPVFTGLLARLSAALRPDVPYVANTPWGGAPVFNTSQGVSHYYGVGAYMRGFDDARRAQVRFASECLALAHVPAEADLAADLARHPLDTHWKRGTPRDLGASWDFDDVRDHYVQTLYGVEPARLRREDPVRYLDLGRAVSCDLVEAVFSEWRRAASPCAGGLVWQWRDLRPGAGWGLLDEAGQPKPVWHALSRHWQPLQLLITDEGLNGLDLHVVHEGDQALDLVLSLQALRDGQRVVVEGQRHFTVAGRGQQRFSSTELLGRFFDTTYAYRFGPPAHDVCVATLRAAHSQALLGWAVHLPQRALPRAELGWQTRLERDDQGLALYVTASRFSQYLHFSSASHRPDVDWFHLPPGVEQCIRLQPREGVTVEPALAGGSLGALNSLSERWVRFSEAIERSTPAAGDAP
ncbi:glycoside hydrolase family 2 protein [Curvibacter sp. RS43]|uniref:glycoside hydrolase family 2 protein n=1 Tax=Curvibacter microcysteis TaxID=3026419 RepID=UPI00236074B9|nr:glycoside hydrolase family 2 protein [Curvibacter sp. RS43]MDD0809713.1 glycoside hydrolase family 2 protein [Curvibacter sp. RS43]